MSTDGARDAEAIEALHFVIETLQIDLIRKEVIPPLLKLLRSDYEEIQIRLAQFIGSLVFKLSKVENLHLEYQDELMEFYKSLCWSKVDQCRQLAVFSFPCFQSLYGRNYSQKPTFQSKQPVGGMLFQAFVGTMVVILGANTWKELKEQLPS